MSLAAYERVKLARDSKRPTGLDYIKNVIPLLWVALQSFVIFP